MNKAIISAFVLFLISIQSKAQDIHFSQFFNTPLAINPAQTGVIKQDFRVNAIYRNQWKAANSTFSTMALVGDANFSPAFLKGDKIGVGFFIFNDQLGNETMTNHSAYASLSYIKTLDPQKRHKVSVGTQFGFVQKRIDYSSLIFSEQIINYQANASAPTGESSMNSRFSYFNMNIGGLYRFKMTSSTDVHLGISAFNLIRPKENFVQQSLENNLNKLKNRGLVNIGGVQKLTRKLYIHPEILLMAQSKAREINAGAALEFAPNANRDLLLLQAGAWVRTKDAMNLYAGCKYHNLLIGFSYDITNSSLNDIKDSPEVADNARIGAYEITLTYLGFFKRALPHELTVPCRIF